MTSTPRTCQAPHPTLEGELCGKELPRRRGGRVSDFCPGSACRSRYHRAATAGPTP
jgi:hypothetical protein